MTKCSTLDDCAIQEAYCRGHAIGMADGLRMVAHGAREVIKIHNLTGTSAKKFEEFALSIERTIKKIESGE